jgi:hypothetical protein
LSRREECSGARETLGVGAHTAASELEAVRSSARRLRDGSYLQRRSASSSGARQSWMERRAPGGGGLGRKRGSEKPALSAPGWLCRRPGAQIARRVSMRVAALARFLPGQMRRSRVMQQRPASRCLRCEVSGICWRPYPKILQIHQLHLLPSGGVKYTVDKYRVRRGSRRMHPKRRAT